MSTWRRVCCCLVLFYSFSTNWLLLERASEEKGEDAGAQNKSCLELVLSIRREERRREERPKRIVFWAIVSLRPSHWPTPKKAKQAREETSPLPLSLSRLSLSPSLFTVCQPWRTPRSSTSRTSSRVRRVSLTRQQTLFSLSTDRRFSIHLNLRSFLSFSLSPRHRTRPGRAQQAPGDHSRPRRAERW